MRPLPLLLLLPLLIACDDPTQPTAAAVIQSYRLPGDRTFPEGIAVAPDGRTFYVGSTTDGTIYRGHTDSVELRPVLPGGADGRTTAVGLKVTPGGLLVVAGGTTGRIFVYNPTTGALVRSFSTGATAESPGFLNDVALTADGQAFVTDSRRDTLYQIAADGSGELSRLPLDGSGIVYDRQPGAINLNGIVASADGTMLLTVQSVTGKLYRLVRSTGTVIPVALARGSLMGGDGLLLERVAGQLTLIAVQNASNRVATAAMSDDLRSGTLGSATTDTRFRFPTTLARVPNGYLLVNGQLNARSGTVALDLPFTVLRLPPLQVETVPGG